MRPAAAAPLRSRRLPTSPSSSSSSAGDGDLVASLHPALQWDLDVVRWLVATRDASPTLRFLVLSTTSRFRTQDVSLLLWLLFLVMLPELGLPYMWVCVGNLLVVLLLQYAAQVMRPIDVDVALAVVRACVDPDTYGFPCVDAHMSVVVLLPVIENTSSWVARAAFAVLAVYISAMRLLLGTRFVSQVVGSWLSGLTGIVVGNHGRLVVKAYKLTSAHNTAAIVALIAFVMVVVGLWVENNESRVVGVPKADFMDVLTNILTSDGAPTTTAAARVHQTPLTDRVRTTKEDEDTASEDQELLGKKDSFFYLMKGMRSRARLERAAGF